MKFTAAIAVAMLAFCNTITASSEVDTHHSDPNNFTVSIETRLPNTTIAYHRIRKPTPDPRRVFMRPDPPIDSSIAPRETPLLPPMPVVVRPDGMMVPDITVPPTPTTLATISTTSLATIQTIQPISRRDVDMADKHHDKKPKGPPPFIEEIAAVKKKGIDLHWAIVDESIRLSGHYKQYNPLSDFFLAMNFLKPGDMKSIREALDRTEKLLDFDDNLKDLMSAEMTLRLLDEAVAIRIQLKEIADSRAMAERVSKREVDVANKGHKKPKPPFFKEIEGPEGIKNHGIALYWALVNDHPAINDWANERSSIPRLHDMFQAFHGLNAGNKGEIDSAIKAMASVLDHFDDIREILSSKMQKHLLEQGAKLLIQLKEIAHSSESAGIITKRDVDIANKKKHKPKPPFFDDIEGPGGIKEKGLELYHDWNQYFKVDDFLDGDLFYKDLYVVGSNILWGFDHLKAGDSKTIQQAIDHTENFLDFEPGFQTVVGPELALQFFDRGMKLVTQLKEILDSRVMADWHH